MALEFMGMAKAELTKKFQIPTSALSFNLQEEDVSRALEASLMEKPDFFKKVAVMHGAWIPEGDTEPWTREWLLPPFVNDQLKVRAPYRCD